MIGKCDKCGCLSEIHEHHILPMGVRKNNASIQQGKRIWLCIKCHIIIHELLPKTVEDFTIRWLNDSS